MLFVVSTLLGTVVSFGIRFLLNLSAFWLLDARGVLAVWGTVGGLLSGLILPLAWFPAWAQAALAWTPFPALFQTPIDVFTERGDPSTSSSASSSGRRSLFALGRAALARGTATAGGAGWRVDRRLRADRRVPDPQPAGLPRLVRARRGRRSCSARAMELVAILVIFTQVTSLGGFSAREVVLIYGLAATAFGLADLAVGQVEALPDYIRTGEFDVMLLRPLGTLPQLLSADVQLRRVGRVAVRAGRAGLGAARRGVDAAAGGGRRRRAAVAGR